MALDLMALVAKLGVDSSEYEKGLDKAESGFSGFASRLKDGVASVGHLAASVATAGIDAIGRIGDAMVKGMGDIASYGDNIDKASQKLGISARAYQEWDAVLQHSGTSIDSLGIGMKTLANAAAEAGNVTMKVTKNKDGTETLTEEANDARDAFKALGINYKEAAKMDRETLFNKTITALQNVKDANRRAQLAQQLFGRSAMELGPLLNTSAKDTQAMKDRVDELGGVMSDKAVKDAAAYQDALQDMTTAADGYKRRFFSSFFPSATQIMDGITDILAGLKGGARKLRSGIKKFIDNLIKQVPQYLKTGLQIASEIGGAIVSEIPGIARKIISALPKLWQALTKYIRNKAIPAFAKLLGDILGLNGSSNFAGRLTRNLRGIFSKVTEALSAIGGKIAEFWKVVVQPILRDIITFINNRVIPQVLNVIDRLKPIWEKVSPLISQAFQSIADFWKSTLFPVLQQIWDYAINTLIPAVIDWVEAAIPVIEDAFNKVSEFWTNTLSPVLTEIYEYVINTLIPKVVDWFENQFQPAFERVFTAIAGFWENTLKPALVALYDYVYRDLIPTLIVWWEYHLQPAIEGVFNAIAGFWNDILKPALEAIYSYVVADLIPTLIVWWEYKLQPVIEAVFNAIKTFWEQTAQPALNAFWEFVRDNVVPIIQTLGEEFQTVMDTYLKPVWTWVSETFIAVWGDLQTGIQGILDFITGTFTGDWEKAWNGLVAMISTPFNALGDILKVPINAVIDLLNGMIRSVRDSINTVIDAINSTLKITIPNVDIDFDITRGLDAVHASWDFENPLWSWSSNIGKLNWDDNPIAKLARGGVVDEGEQAWVGEYAPELLRVVGGKAMVTPMSKVPARFPGGGQEIAVPRQDNRPVNIVFELDGAQKWVYRLNKLEEQRVGLKLSKGAEY